MAGRIVIEENQTEACYSVAIVSDADDGGIDPEGTCDRFFHWELEEEIWEKAQARKQANEYAHALATKHKLAIERIKRS